MMRWNNDQRQEDGESRVNFHQLLSRNDIDAFHISSSTTLTDDIKQRNNEFTEAIVKLQHRGILFELIDIALRPQHFSKQKQLEISKVHTFNAIEILSNLSEQFVQEVLTEDKADVKQCAEDDVLQQDNNEQKKRQFPILNKLFLILSDARPISETPLSYLSRLIAPLLYQKPTQVVEHIFKNEILLKRLFSHYYSRSIGDLINKMLQVENQKQFYEKQKMEIIKKLSQSIDGEHEEALLEDILQNFAALLENLLQKYQDKFDRSKYINFVKEILNQKSIFAFVTKKIEDFNQNKDIKVQALIIMDIYFKFTTNPKPQSKVSDNSQSSISEVRLNPQIIAEFSNFLNNHGIQYFVSAKKIEHIYYLRIIKSLITLDYSLIDKLINKEFLIQTFTVMVQNKNNDILHNLQKQIVVFAIKKGQNADALLLTQEVGFTALLKQCTTEGNSKLCFQNQLYHIGQALLQKSKQKSSITQQLQIYRAHLEKQKVFYDTLIAGNPRASYQQQWDDLASPQIILSYNPFSLPKPAKLDKDNNFPSQCENVLFKNQFVIVQQITKLQAQEVVSQQQDQPQLQDNNNKHYIDFELPLDSDKSVEEISGDISKESAPIANLSAEIHMIAQAKQEQERLQEEKEDVLGNNSQYFQSHLSYNIDQILSEMEE